MGTTGRGEVRGGVVVGWSGRGVAVAFFAKLEERLQSATRVGHIIYIVYYILYSHLSELEREIGFACDVLYPRLDRRCCWRRRGGTELTAGYKWVHCTCTGE